MTRQNKLAAEIERSLLNSGCAIPSPFDTWVRQMFLKLPRQHNTGGRPLGLLPVGSTTSLMQRRSSRIGLAVFGLYLVFVPSSVASADPDNGRRLADRWCSACHVVATNQQRASADVPPFSTIARAPGFNAERLAFFLLEPHPRMPSMALSRKEATDIADYIKHLRDAN
jgi:mono/diheme cytochrome c family protein